ncbi:hypothetical protein PR048_005986 [Dryococelus australis]|uniref:DDE-1 domain-containing protein n=1 Tax=Dryococelus australis TaxID=614101 RepID=A0ABQ9IAW6_9NEOP|nr:hypothetical protein PR048_005986 [Dryococelus australis]
MGTPTVQNPKKISAPKGVKQLNKAASGEKGTLVTTCYIISASGIAVPPAKVFTWVNFKEHMFKGAPPGTLGLAAQFGWKNSELFAKSSSITALDIAKDNEVIVLTIPPHCSNHMQPLDISVSRSFQMHYNAAIESWMLHHPGSPLTIYEIAECVGIAFQCSMSPTNICSGFH